MSKSDDIVSRLRAWHVPGETVTGDVQLYLDAADEIERLRAVLQRIADAADGRESVGDLIAMARGALGIVEEEGGADGVA